MPDLGFACFSASSGHWEEPEEAGKSDSELQGPRNGKEPAGLATASSQGLSHGPCLADPCLLLTASLQAQVVLSFQAYPIARCALLEVQVPADLVQPGQSVVCEVLLLTRRATSRIPDSQNNPVH